MASAASIPLGLQAKAILKILATAILHPRTPHDLVIDQEKGTVRLEPIRKKGTG